MSSEQPGQAQRPTPNDRDAWKACWTALGMSWRTELWRGKRGYGSWQRVGAWVPDY
jgi:hypothetical protein